MTRDISRLKEGAPGTQWVEARVLLHSLPYAGRPAPQGDPIHVVSRA